MPLTNGRSDDNKERILQAYDLSPIIHTVVANEELRCCCNGRIGQGRRYHLFRANPRNDQSGKLTQDILYAGPTCARNFARLNPSIKLLPLIDPFELLEEGSGEAIGPNGQGRPAGDDVNHKSMHPLTREVMTAIAILVLYYKVPKPGGPLDSIIKDITNLDGAEVPARIVKSIDTMAAKANGMMAVWDVLQRRFGCERDKPTFPLMTQIIGEKSIV